MRDRPAGPGPRPTTTSSGPSCPKKLASLNVQNLNWRRLDCQERLFEVLLWVRSRSTDLAFLIELHGEEDCICFVDHSLLLFGKRAGIVKAPPARHAWDDAGSFLFWHFMAIGTTVYGRGTGEVLFGPRHVRWLHGRPTTTIEHTMSGEATSTGTLSTRCSVTGSTWDTSGPTMGLKLLTHSVRRQVPFVMEVATRAEADKKGGRRRVARCCASLRSAHRRTRRLSRADLVALKRIFVDQDDDEKCLYPLSRESPLA